MRYQARYKDDGLSTLCSTSSRQETGQSNGTVSLGQLCLFKASNREYSYSDKEGPLILLTVVALSGPKGPLR